MSVNAGSFRRCFGVVVAAAVVVNKRLSVFPLFFLLRVAAAAAVVNKRLFVFPFVTIKDLAVTERILLLCSNSPAKQVHQRLLSSI